MLLIDRWLTGNQNFIIGRNLYDTYGANNALKNLFAKGETSHAAKLLIESLQAINQSGARQKITSDTTSLLAMPKGSDNMLQAIEEAWKPKYNRMIYLRHKLDEFGTDNSTETRAKCFDICKEVLLLEKEVNALWQQRDYYQEHGRLPIVKKAYDLPTTALGLGRFIETCKRQIRRYKATMATNTNHAQIYQDNLAKYKAATGEDYETKKNN